MSKEESTSPPKYINVKLSIADKVYLAHLARLRGVSQQQLIRDLVRYAIKQMHAQGTLYPAQGENT
jgi:hypothetical protein